MSAITANSSSSSSSSSVNPEDQKKESAPFEMYDLLQHLNGFLCHSDSFCRPAILEQVPADFAELHPLKNEWTFWFNQRMPGARTHESFEKQIKKIGSFQSVCHFSSYFPRSLD
jgi:hypothetical protein